MVSPRFKNTMLWVKAKDNAEVREIDSFGRPLAMTTGMGFRNIGRDAEGNVIDEGVKIPYHSHYIARLKEGMLLPMDLATAQLAGVAWNPELIMK